MQNFKASSPGSPFALMVVTYSSRRDFTTFVHFAPSYSVKVVIWPDFLARFIGVQYASGWAICQAKSNGSFKYIDKIQTVRVQFPHETTGYKDQ
jgi:hypothetical protein